MYWIADRSLQYSISSYKFEIYEKDLELGKLATSNGKSKDELAVALQMMEEYERQLKELRKQVDALAQDNSGRRFLDFGNKSFGSWSFDFFRVSIEDAA